MRVFTQCHATAGSAQISARTFNIVTSYSLVRGHQNVTPSSGQKLNVVPTYELTQGHNAKTITQAYQHFYYNNNYNNNNYYYYYLLQLGCHPVAVVILHVHKT